jgi:hypothetical protein
MTPLPVQVARVVVERNPSNSSSKSVRRSSKDLRGQTCAKSEPVENFYKVGSQMWGAILMINLSRFTSEKHGRKRTKKHTGGRRTTYHLLHSNQNSILYNMHGSIFGSEGPASSSEFSSPQSTTQLSCKSAPESTVQYCDKSQASNPRP